MAKPAACTSGLPFAPLVLAPAPSFALLSCGNVGASCSVQAAAKSTLNACNLDLSLDASTVSGLQTFECARVVFTVPVGLPGLRLEKLSFSSTELTFAATSPVTIELAQSTLKNVRVQLRGPVTLRLSEASDVQSAQFIDKGPGGASVELSESRSRGMSVDLSGSLTVERSSLATANLFAQSARLETVIVSNTEIAVSRLAAVDLQGKGLTLEFEDGTLSGAIVNDVRLQKCGVALISRSTMYDSYFGACSDKARFDQGAVGRSLLVGMVEGHVMIWDSNTFGPGTSPTTLESWNGSLANSRFCPGTQKAALIDVGGVQCNVCDELAAPEQVFCRAGKPPLDPSMVDFVVVPPTYYVDGGDGIGPSPLCPLLEMLPDCDPVPIDDSPF